MSATVALVGSLVTIVCSALATWATVAKTRADRKAGVDDAAMDRTRFGLDAMRAALDAKEMLLEDYREQIRDLKARVEELEGCP